MDTMHDALAIWNGIAAAQGYSHLSLGDAHVLLPGSASLAYTRAIATEIAGSFNDSELDESHYQFLPINFDWVNECADIQSVWTVQVSTEAELADAVACTRAPEHTCLFAVLIVYAGDQATRPVLPDNFHGTVTDRLREEGPEW